MNPISLIMKLTGLGKVASTLALIATVIALLGVAKCSYDRSMIANHDAEITTKTMKIDADAKEKAATERAADTSKINIAEKDRNDEIRKAPDSRPGSARNALNCERLRRQGKDTSGIAACR